MRIRLVVTAGVSSGHVTCQKPWRRLAPSILAASCSSSGMVWSPARKMTIVMPMFDQIWTTVTHDEGLRRAAAQELRFGAHDPKERVHGTAQRVEEEPPHQALDRDPQDHRQEEQRAEPAGPAQALVEQDRGEQAQRELDGRHEEAEDERPDQGLDVLPRRGATNRNSR